jgi:hypothetical protein
MDAVIALAQSKLTQARLLALEALAGPVCKQIHHECFVARQELGICEFNHRFSTLCSCNICGRNAKRIYDYDCYQEAFFLGEYDKTSLLQVCKKCNPSILTCMARVISSQVDNYIFQYAFIRDTLGRDLAGVIARYYYIVALTVELL